MEIIYEKNSPLFDGIWLYDKENQIVFAKFIGTYNVPLIIQGDRIMMDFITENPTKLVYTDLLDAKGSFSEMNKFAKEELNPHIEKHGVRFVGFVTTKDIFSRYAFNYIMKFVNGKTHVKFFGDHTSAVKWASDCLEKNIRLPKQLIEDC